MASLPGELGSAYYRECLTPQGQTFYDGIYAQLLRKDYSGETTVSISNPEGAASDCFAAYKALRDDHPECFYLGFQSEFTRSGGTGTFRYTILYSPEIIERIRQQMRRCICRIVRGTADLQTVERETLVYERIARTLTYANHGDVRDHNIVGPVLLSSGVCEGQNALLLLCFRRIGIPCIKVYGRTHTYGGHCWTIAWVNGVPVHCDVTWDGAREGIVCFHYFNLSDGQIGRNHYAFQGAHIPACTSEAFGYYSYYGRCVRSFRELRERLRADSGREPIRLHFDYDPPAGDYSEEVRRALQAEHICVSHRLYYYPSLKNMAVISV